MSRIDLADPAIAGRLRRSPATPVARRSYLISDFRPVVPKPQPAAPSSRPVQVDDPTVIRPSPALPSSAVQGAEPAQRRYSKFQLSLAGLAGVVFVLGLSVSLQGFRTNHNVTAQVSALSSHGGSSAPDTAKPSASTVQQYAVAPDLPRYLRIPKLGVFARVMQVGVNSSGALGTPSNVYDTAWYTGSAKPGQAGATLIDGHISSWTTKGVFYGLNKLSAGDQIQIERGDGTLLNYRVVRTQTYDAVHVDMQAAITPVTSGKNGLNLISCTGKVIKGTSQFSQRVIVFAEQE